MQKQEYPYLTMFCCDASGVSVERWNDSWSVDMHCHEYCELMIVNRGSCRHAFHGIENLMIPGDVILIPAHEAHGYALSGEISLYNCQFVPAQMDEEVIRRLDTEGVLHGVGEGRAAKESVFWEHLVADREEMHTDVLPSYEFNSSKQGVIHLRPSELTFILSLLEHMLEAQQAEEEDCAIRKRKYAELILLEVCRAIRNQNRKYADCSAGNQKIIAAVLTEIENNLTEPFDIAEVAKRYAFSPNYLRKLFKDFTGVAPVQYLNRLRMIRACECLEQRTMSIKEVAEYVGIYDLNYFSRLFKKVIGCSPTQI